MTQATFVSDVTTAANGRWPELLANLGIDVPRGGKHGPCPTCGGKDRFRLDDKGGRGTWICSRCDPQSGDGLDLVCLVTGKGVKAAAEMIAPLVGLSGSGLDPAERERIEQRQRDNAEATRKQAEQQRKKAIRRAADIVRDCQPGQSPYLERKRLFWPAGALTRTLICIGDETFQPGALVVPLRSEVGDLVNVQIIQGDGTKRYLPGGQKADAFHRIDGGALVAVVEGYATGLSVHLATGATVYCAMDSGNLLAVAETARRHHPEAHILLCGDNDEVTKGNPGKTKAEQAAAAVGAQVAIPPMPGDWNDYHQTHDLPATKEAIQKGSALADNVLSFRPLEPVESEPELDPDALSKMPASRLGRLLSAKIGTSAVCRESGIVYQYGEGVWLPVSDARLVPMLAEMFDQVDCPYTAKKLSGAVETMKVGLPEMGQPAGGLIGFANGVYDMKARRFRAHSPSDYLPSHNGIEYGEPLPGEALEQHAPSFTKWLTHAAGGDADKMDRIKAALYMVLANRYDWQLFLEVTGEGGSGKSVMANLCELLVGRENVGSTSMEAMRGSFGLENVWDKRLILLPDQSQYIGDGALLKAITGGDEVAVNRKGKAMFGAKVRAVVIATNNDPMKMTERNGGISRRRVIFAFNNVVADADKDPTIGSKIAIELPVIIRNLLARFADPELAKRLLLEQRDGAEALAVKQEADPVIAMCALLEFLSETTGLRVGGGNAAHDPIRFLYHFYLEYLRAEGLDRPLHRTAFGKAMKTAAKAYGEEYQTRRSNGDSVTNVKLRDEARSVLPPARLLDD